MAKELTIVEMRHPVYRKNITEWSKWRCCYGGGRDFVNRYLKKFSTREPLDDFRDRKSITYPPRFAGSAIDDIKNSIYQRMADITRVGGSKTYLDAVTGSNGGVDQHGSSMNKFMGQGVLPELLVMGRVGVYIDMPTLDGPTMAENKGKHPYLYHYTAEEIQTWSGYYVNGHYRFTSLLLKEQEEEEDELTGLIKGQRAVFRYYQLTPEGVKVQFLDAKSQPIEQAQVITGLKRIPFVLVEVIKSFMEDVADYQIALLNLESSDISYILKSNFPFYTEQFDPRAEGAFTRRDTEGEDDPDLKRKEAVTGNSAGRRYPAGLDRPGFIHPSSEPLKASMDKENQIKSDIRHLLNLTLSQVEPNFASAESKGMDDRSLESGLSALGLILQHAEAQISEIWASYMNDSPTTITYPRTYSLKSEAERRDESKSDAELMSLVPSRTFQKEVAKKIAKNTVGHIISQEVLDKITKEVDSAKYISSDPEAIATDLDNGLVSDQTASIARGYDPDEAEKAKKDHAERIARVQKAQTPITNPGARGAKDLNPDKGNLNPDNPKPGDNNGATGE